MLQDQKLAAFAIQGLELEVPLLQDDFRFEVWRPGLTRMTVPGLGLRNSLLLWFCNQCHVFRNSNYLVIFIKRNSQIVHRSCVLPAACRWPFMESDDLQISSTWTDPAFRGTGLATAALIHILHLLKKPNRRFWYFVREENLSSIAVCRKAGFQRVGTLRRIKWFGMRLLSQFSLNSQHIEPFLRPAMENAA